MEAFMRLFDQTALEAGGGGRFADADLTGV